jgi:hypothetical protein
MAVPSGQLDGGGNQAEVASKDPRHAQVHQDIIDAINRLAVSVGASPTGEIPAPKPPDAVDVKVVGEMVHVSINHSGPIERGINYFTEVTPNTTPNTPIVYHHGTSRTPPPFTLPTYPDGGGAKTQYTIHSYTQHPGGAPSGRTLAAGGPFEMAGTTQMTLLPGRGSGTAPNNGQSAGQGFGVNQRRDK